MLAGASERSRIRRGRRPLGIKETLELVFLFHVTGGDREVTYGGDYAVERLRSTAQVAAAQRAREQQKTNPRQAMAGRQGINFTQPRQWRRWPFVVHSRFCRIHHQKL
jgi:hypothetical protein